MKTKKQIKNFKGEKMKFQINKKVLKAIFTAKGKIDTNYAIQHFMRVHLSVGFNKKELKEIVNKTLEAK